MDERALIDTARPELRDHRISDDGRIVDVSGEYWLERVAAFHEENRHLESGGIVFVGDSITEGFRVGEMFPGLEAINRGISGDKIGGSRFYGVLDRVDVSVAELNPRKVFLLIGVNDIIFWDVPPREMRRGYKRLLRRIREVYSDGLLYVETLLPLRGEYEHHMPEALQFNEYLKTLAPAFGATLLDVHAAFRDEHGLMREDYTTDGLHLSPKGYERLGKVLLPAVHE